jgi:hypothetical protein
MILSEPEIVAITNRKRHKAQAKVLTALGIPITVLEIIAIPCSPIDASQMHVAWRLGWPIGFGVGRATVRPAGQRPWIKGRKTTLTRRWRFSDRLTGVPSKLPFAALVANMRIQ